MPEVLNGNMSTYTKVTEKPHDFIIYSHLISGCVYPSSNCENFLRSVINRDKRKCSLSIQLFEIFSKHTDVKNRFCARDTAASNIVQKLHLNYILSTCIVSKNCLKTIKQYVII